MIAAGAVTQGKPQSLFRMITGLAPLEIKHDERGSWSRESVRVIDPSTTRVSNGGMLDLAGEERIPVTWDGDPSTGELIDLLSR